MQAESAGLNAETGALVALYARSLSAVARDQRRSGKGGELERKSTEELAEMAMQVPELRELLKGRR